MPSPCARYPYVHFADIANRAGTPIIAPADGIVTYAGRKGLIGNMVAIDHGFGMMTRYGHLKKILKKKGSRVKRGETIALVGTTGRSTGPHLHYEVFKAGRHVDLSPTEFKLLRYLMANPGRVLSKAQILDHVWHYDFEGDPNVVETYVSYLRKKTEAIGPRLIHTVRGFGYVLREEP